MSAMTLKEAARYGWEHSNWSLENVLLGIEERERLSPNSTAQMVEKVREVIAWHRSKAYACGLRDQDAEEGIAHDELADRLTAAIGDKP